MYDYDVLNEAAYAFYQLGIITYEDYGDMTYDLDRLVSAKDERIIFD